MFAEALISRNMLNGSWDVRLGSLLRVAVYCSFLIVKYGQPLNLHSVFSYPCSTNNQQVIIPLDVLSDLLLFELRAAHLC